MGSVVVRLDHYRASFLKRKPKMPRRVSKPRRASSSVKVKKCLAGIDPDDFHIQTAEGLTPAKEAAAESPPTASTIDSTSLSMPPYTSTILNVSSVQESSMDESKESKFHGDMAIDRGDVIARLNLLPEVLGQSHKEIAELIGATPRDWSNWRNVDGPARIPADRAWELYRVFGLSMDWVYGGDLNQIRDQRLRQRIIEAERKLTRRRANP